MIKKQTLLLCLLFSGKPLFSQQPREKIAMVIDSIFVRQDPEPGNDLKVTEVADLRVVKNKDSLGLLGFTGYDGVTFIFTMAYRSRPDSIRIIPSSRQMEKKEGAWYYRDQLYTGRIIDYYYSGKKQSEGRMANGRVDGLRRIYYSNGQLMNETNYHNGLEEGLIQAFYPDSSLHLKGNWVHGKEEGIWDNYFPNGQIEQRASYLHGQPTDTIYRYYSSGRIKERVFFQNGKLKEDPQMAKIAALVKKSKERSDERDYESAIKYCNKIIALDSGFASAWFSKATLELNQEKFDPAIADFDRALHFEPYLKAAYANRAFARIRKAEFSGSRSILKNSEVTVMAAKDKVEIPTAEKEKICTDLNQAVFLGQTPAMVYEERGKYCE